VPERWSSGSRVRDRSVPPAGRPAIGDRPRRDRRRVGDTPAVARIAVIGLGEAGSAIARDLRAAGAAVVGFDPAVPDGGVEPAASAAEAAGGADVVLSVNAASAAGDVARSVAGALGPDAVFADLNTASPGAKRAVAAIVEAGPGGARFADVALMAPVAGRGLRTPALVSGPGADRFADVVGRLGMPVTAIGPEAGAAAARKLVRSVFMKGLAAAIGEALEAAEAIGGRDALYADIAATLTGADEALLRRLVEGSAQHAARRAEEMAAARAMLEELGVEPRVAAASEAWLRSLRAAGG
jgi:3-hydroxyisobutyrate dehydrogenase-like beta-hydroxyacid dehydrogenase